MPATRWRFCICTCVHHEVIVDSLEIIIYNTIHFSSTLRVVSSGCKRARKERGASPCGDLASKTATLWKPALEDRLWVSLGLYLHAHVQVNVCYIRLSLRMIGDRKGSHFTTRDLKSIGFNFCDTLLDYCDPDPTKVGLKQDLCC